LLAGAVDADSPRILASEQIQTRQTGRGRAQVGHAGEISRPMRHDAKQRSAVGIVNKRKLGLIGIKRRALLGISSDRLSM
jgi:hypothetical protein